MCVVGGGLFERLSSLEVEKCLEADFIVRTSLSGTILLLENIRLREKTSTFCLRTLGKEFTQYLREFLTC